MFNTLIDVLRQIRRTPYQAVAAVMVIFLTFFVSAFFVLLAYGSLKVMQYFETTPQVIAFFTKGVDLSDERVTEIRSKLEQTGRLDSFKYVSTKEAEAIYKERNKDNPLLLELVDYKILPPSIEVSANQIDALTSLKQVLESEEGVTDIVFFEDIVKNLSVWIKNIRTFGGGVLTFLAGQSILIIFVIMNMKILARKEELEVLLLIGATKGFIKRPFLLEGMIYGLTGALLAFIFCYGLVLYATPSLIGWFGDIPILPLPSDFLTMFLAVQAGGGLLIGLTGSYISATRFIRRK